ncbi:hypothetical protein LINPERHAP2_LOCUS9504 [Linum perenne]
MFVQNSLNQLWHYDGSIEVIEVGFGLLQVVFPSVDTVNWVLERRPWSLNMNVMNMVPFSPPSVEIFKELQFMAVWIKLSRVPSHCVTTRFGREFLPFFGSDEKDAENGSFVASSKQPWPPPTSRKMPKDGARPPIGRCPHHLMV